jgi:periplasmic divalent cation tolerance protein
VHKLYKTEKKRDTMPFILIYTTNRNHSEAQKISEHLLKKKLIACSNMFPIQSKYWWKGKIEKTVEVVSILKTRKELYDKVKKEIEKIHSYSVPCIIKIDVSANAKYEDWIRKET